MEKILFVTNRNILTTSGELRLIKNRAEALYEYYNMPSDFIVFARRERINSSKRESIDAGGTLKCFETSMKNPMSVLHSYIEVKKEIKKRLSSKQYSSVILSGFGMLNYAKKIKKEFLIPVYIDIHGAFEDMIEVAKKKGSVEQILFHLMYYMDQLTILCGLKYIDGFFVVTNALKDYIKTKFKINARIKFYVVPCATKTVPFSNEEYRVDREKYRKKYKIDSDTIVFVYSGGISTWQCVSETVELYKEIANSIPNKTKMLIFSHNVDEIRQLAGDDKSVEVDSYTPEELYHALHAGDFAFLLRKDNTTNNVAFPNKFLEYVQSGMSIITTPYVYEIAKQVEKYDLGYIYKFDGDIKNLSKFVLSNAETEKKEEKINTVLTHNSYMNTLKSFAER